MMGATTVHGREDGGSRDAGAAMEDVVRDSSTAQFRGVA
jgi:hypothetical protein